jgi:hypothetical protein
MELIIKDDINVNLGDVVYYVNTGLAKSHSDIKKVTDKNTGIFEIQYNSKLIPQTQIDANPDLTTDEYNVAKYLSAFNKRVEKLLVCFNTEIRGEIIVNVYKDKKTKLVKLQERSVFTEKQCQLTSGNPLEEKDQDSYEALMVMEDKEIRFWDSVDMLPNNMEMDEWSSIRLDWIERMKQERLDGIADEKQRLYSIIMRLETSDLNEIREGGLPTVISNLIYIYKDDNDVYSLKSLLWNEILYDFNVLFEHEDEAIKRATFYSTINGEHEPSDLYDMWLEHLNPTPPEGQLKLNI